MRDSDAPRHSRSRARTMVCTAVLLLKLAVVGIACWLLLDERTVLTRETGQATTNQVLSLIQDVERSLLRYDFALREAAAELAAEQARAEGRPEAWTETRAEQAMRARPLAAFPKQFGSILSVNSVGRVFRLGGPPLDSQVPWPGRLAELDVFRKHQEHPELGLLVSGPMPAEDGSGWLVVLSRRASREDDSFAGVVAGAVRLEYFTKVFEQHNLGKGGLAGLLRDDGTVIAHWPASLNVTGKNLRDGELFRHLEKSPGGLFEGAFMLDGVQRQYAYQRMGGMPFVLSVGRSIDVIYAPWWRKTALVGTVLLGLLAVAAGLVVALRRELWRREAAERFAHDAGRAARASLAELRALFDHMQDGLLVMRAAPGGFVFDGLNRPAEAILGVSADQVIGRPLDEAWPGRHAGLMREQVRRCAVTAQAATFDLRQEASGETRELRVTLAPVHAGEEADEADPDMPAPPADCVLGTVRDVTERTRLEGQLRQAQKMEAVGRLTAGVAHDFNNLLQTVLGSLELLEESGALDEHTKEFAQLASQAARRGATLTHQLLAFSRQQVLRSRPVDLRVLMGGLHGLLVHTLGPGIEVAVQVEPDTWPVLVDGAQFDACLLTLAINARDAMQHGGCLRLHARNVPAYREEGTPSQLPAGRDFVEVRVEDTGTGMSADVLERAFDPFFTTKPLGEASGLGLSVVQGFVAQSGGAIRLDSVPGRGTTVTVWLPRAGEPARTLPPRPAMKGRRVLLVDDDAQVRRSLLLMLASVGFDVVPAASAHEAFGLLRAERFDALLADQKMPDMTGAELVARSLAEQPTLPAIVITGSEEIAGPAGLPDAVQVLHKPITRAALVEAIGAAVTARAGEVSA